MAYQEELNKMAEDLNRAKRDFIAAEKKRSEDSDDNNHQKCKAKHQYLHNDFLTFRKIIKDLDIDLNDEIEKSNA